MKERGKSPNYKVDLGKISIRYKARQLLEKDAWPFSSSTRINEPGNLDNTDLPPPRWSARRCPSTSKMLQVNGFPINSSPSCTLDGAKEEIHQKSRPKDLLRLPLVCSHLLDIQKLVKLAV